MQFYSGSEEIETTIEKVGERGGSTGRYVCVCERRKEAAEVLRPLKYAIILRLVALAFLPLELPLQCHSYLFHFPLSLPLFPFSNFRAFAAA